MNIGQAGARNAGIRINLEILINPHCPIIILNRLAQANRLHDWPQEPIEVPVEAVGALVVGKGDTGKN